MKIGKIVFIALITLGLTMGVASAKKFQYTPTPGQPTVYGSDHNDKCSTTVMTYTYKKQLNLTASLIQSSNASINAGYDVNKRSKSPRCTKSASCNDLANAIKFNSGTTKTEAIRLAGPEACNCFFDANYNNIPGAYGCEAS